jgi:restriction endonuclease Mrr
LYPSKIITYREIFELHMDVDELVGSAEGTIWGTVLRSDRDGYVPPGIAEWPPGPPPIAYFEEGEQPHFMGIGLDCAMKVKAEEGAEVESLSRVPISKKQRGIKQDGQIGYVPADEAYQNIIFITNNRLLILIGKEDGYLDVEFPYADDDVTALSITDDSLMNQTTSQMEADGLVYDLSVQVHRKERDQAYQYIHEQTSLAVPELETQTTGVVDSEETETTQTANTDLNSLISLTPEGFETYVADVWRARGYSCTLTKGSGDAGVDVIANRDGKRELLQAKRYSEQNVGINTVQRTAGLLVDSEFDASEVAIVTTSSFTDDAENRARRIEDLVLVDGKELLTLGNNAGVSITDSKGEPIYSQEAATDDVLALLKPGEPLTTGEIVEELNAPPNLVVGKLKQLHDANRVQAKQVSQDQVIWFKNHS